MRSTATQPQGLAHTVVGRPSGAAMRTHLEDSRERLRRAQRALLDL
jgi:hypothetical protein